MAEILVNGVRQGWGDIIFVVLGREVTGITKFGVSTKQDKTNEFGQGREAVHRGRGKKEYTCDGMTLYKYEIDAILDLLPEGSDLTDVPPFTVICIYTPVGDDILRKLIVPMAEFTEMKHNTKEGDKSVEVECSLVIGKPIWNKK